MGLAADADIEGVPADLRLFRGLAQEELDRGGRLVQLVGDGLGDHVQSLGVDGLGRLLLPAGAEREDGGDEKEASVQLRSL